MLEHREVRGHLEPRPHRLLEADRAIRAAPDQIAERLGTAHQRHRDDARRVADLQRAVDVEAEQHRADQGSPAPGTSTRYISMRPSVLSAMAGPLPVLVSTNSVCRSGPPSMHA